MGQKTMSKKSSISEMIVDRDQFEVELIINIYNILTDISNNDYYSLRNLNLNIPHELLTRMIDNYSKRSSILSYKKDFPEDYYKFIKRIFNKLLYANLNMFENSIQTGDVKDSCMCSGDNNSIIFKK